MAKTSIESPDLPTALSKRIGPLQRWLAENASACVHEQKHLDEGSAERTYWHYGYLCALRDILKLLTTRRAA